MLESLRRSVGRACLLTSLAALVTSRAACASEPAAECSFHYDPPLAFDFDRLVIDPLDTDPAITLLTDQRHVVYVPRHLTTLRDPLFVFLPGTGANPGSYENILRGGAYLGYRAIGLSYFNPVTIFSRCASIPEDPECSLRARRENQEGVDVSDEIDVGPADSIENRLLRLLEWLHAERPAEGWDAYYEGDALTWSRVALGGHSQGGTQTAFIARSHELARAVHFSHIGELYGSEVDGLRVTPWSTEPRATPMSRTYALHHDQEQTSEWNDQVFAALGLDAYGPVESLDDVVAPYGCTHTLSISSPAADAHEAHNMTAVDSAMPTGTDGLPLYTEGVLYLLSAESP